MNAAKWQGADARTSSSSPNELFQRALADLDVDRRARNAGVNDQPPTSSTTLDANEREFVEYFSNFLRSHRDACETVLASQAGERTATSRDIDIDQTRASLAAVSSSLQPDLARLRQDHESSLRKLRDEEARSLRELRHFQAEHRLLYRQADQAPSVVWHFAIVAVFAVLEWISLSIFYAEGSDFGLLGGVLMAMALSFINIVLAVIAGAILRYLNHISWTRKLLAALAFLVLAWLFTFATGFAAHYRIAAQEVASAQQMDSARPSHESDKRALPSSPRALGSGDEQWKVSQLAWTNFQKQYFVFHDVLSWLLVILATIFGFIAVWKGYGIDDRYPGYGPISRKYKDQCEKYEGAKRIYTNEVDRVFASAGNKQQELLRGVRRNIEHFQQLAEKSKSEARAYEDLAKAASGACNNVVVRYREQNRQVASSSPPRYFADPVVLDPALSSAPEPLSSENAVLLERYVNAIAEFTQLIQGHDSTRQESRSQYLSGLSEFFLDIERAIEEKLAREAAQIAT